MTSRLKIRDAIKKKGARYGKPELPYVVFVNCIGACADDEEIQEALYGRDGVWRSTAPASFTRLSVVAAIRHLFPWSVSRAGIRLFHNPRAAHPYTGMLSALPEARLVDGRVVMSPGAHPREWFALAEAWPGGVAQRGR